MTKLESQALDNMKLTTQVADAEQITQFVSNSIEEVQSNMPDTTKFGISYVFTENEKKIQLLYDGKEISSLDASEFVKDGMV